MAPTPTHALSRQHLPNLGGQLWEPDSAVHVQPMRKSKVILLGNSGVGKTSLLYSHKYGPDVTPCSATIGASYVNCEMNVNSEIVQLQIWDTAGQERYRCMIPMYLRNAIGAILVYDITDRRSFDEVGKWLQDLQSHALTQPVLVLVGAKADCANEREVSRIEGECKAHKLNADFFELSAFDPPSIHNMLSGVARKVNEKQKREPELKQVELIRVQPWKRCSPPHSPTSSGAMSPTSSEELILSSNASSLCAEARTRAELDELEVDGESEKSRSPCCSVM